MPERSEGRVACALQSGVEQMTHLTDIAADHLTWNGGPWRQGLVAAPEPPRVFSRHYGGLACNSPYIEQ
jgi:hypothetical protein